MFGVGILIASNGFLCLSLVLIDQKAKNKIQPSIIISVAEIFRNRNFNVYTFLSGLLNLGQTNFFGFLTLFLTEAVRVSQPVASIAIGLAQFTSALARVILGVLSDRFFVGRRKVLKAWVCGAAALFLGLMVFAGDQHLGLWFVLGLTVGLGVTIAAFAPIAQVIAVEIVPERLAGTAIGYNLLGVHCGGFLGPIIFGAAMDSFEGSYGAGWTITAILTGIAVLLLIFVFKEEKSDK